ncbi:phenylalanine--tRNA ligase subunit beta [Bacteriovorax stolpii]|uniref:Phenylalanine--tRNA ligase beta subunit n=1 Tax=Bacteriovorax stolpii TaxID=960 RepID=A0A2K9NST0_BACTC|nr:phenylalanine--tRNA ligase subunit beta [Bacteriovorax stolpii]AUN98552.1 phenylalanine--tRNA ligase subunit beta [Bacteriovorax stolpii]TDP55946.1 phenylalanyl-tRNA synthetase beta subunit [Bacteriovorax stolpii]
MLISLDWIRDFTDVPNVSSKDIYSKFTLATAEVEDVQTVGEHLEKIVIAEILSFEKHPEADKLNLVTFTIGNNDVRKVVCGASNVKVGIKIPYASIGVKLPNGLLLEPKKIRGVLSEGMLCSEEELGFAEESEGIMELPADAPLGVNMLTYFKMKKDTILDIDNKSLTHRPDLWGHFGMAREFSTIFDIPLKNRFTKEWSDNLKKKYTNEKSPISVRFDGESAGISYFGLSMKNVTVGESPDWLKNRLKATGLRSINNIVDVSNYVMLELGMPLHIFDRDLIAGGEVVIKKLAGETTFKTLDEVDRKLIAGDTVISDSNGPLVLAGIMGGLNSGVSEKTKNIFIEVANWKPAMVRRTSTRLGLRSDSSQRFEKTLDSKLTERTLLRTVEMILELCPGAEVVGKAEYAGIDLNSIPVLKIETTLKKIKTVLGFDLTEERLLNIFAHLDFETTKQGDKFLVTIPSYRSTKDIEQEADLIEEVGRIIGYDNILPGSPLDIIAPVKLTEMQKVQRRVRDFMVLQAKAFETMSYPLIGDSLLKKVSWPTSTSLKLIDSLSVDHNLMRPSLIPSLLEVCETNAKNFDRFRFFELGRAYTEDQKSFAKEALHLGAVFADKEKNPYVDMINVVSNLLSSLNLSAEFVERNAKFSNPLVPTEWIGNHPFEFQNIRVMGKFVGAVFSVHPMVLRALKVKGHVCICLFDLSMFENFSAKDKTKYKPLSKFPSSTFDWTVVAAPETLASEVLGACKKVKLKELKEVQILDIFSNENKKFVTIRATLADEAQTLTSELLKQAETALIDATSKAGFNLK